MGGKGQPREPGPTNEPKNQRQRKRNTRQGNGNIRTLTILQLGDALKRDLERKVLRWPMPDKMMPQTRMSHATKSPHVTRPTSNGQSKK
jgi:hypothetical protein